MSASTSKDSAHEDGDRVVRAITDDDNFRVITAATTQTVSGALAAQKVQGVTARHFGELLTGTILIRETMSPAHRVQGLLKAPGRGSLVADAHPDGLTRGLVQLADGIDTFGLTDGSVLQMMRSMANGRVHRSVVKAPSDGGVSTALMTYMQESEQIVSVIATGIAFDGDGAVTCAGGFVVQLLPGAERGPLMVMTERLESQPPVEQQLVALQADPRRLMDELLYGMPHAQLDVSPLRYGCLCSREVVVASLSTVPRDELQEMIREDGVIELSCDYCGTGYRLGRTHLEGLFSES
jgi:molecular chaperone Hsp33